MSIALILAALTVLGVYGLSRAWETPQQPEQHHDGPEGQVMPPAA